MAISYPGWIHHGSSRPYTCRYCGSRCLLNYESDFFQSDFCPHCGKDMRVEPQEKGNALQRKENSDD